MTTIRDMTAPPVDGERRHAGADGSGVRIVALLAVSAIVLTLMNLIAASYLYKASAQVRLVQKQLDELSAFERRLIGRLDLVNNGIQGQFDKLNSDLLGRFSEIQDGIGGLTKSLDALEHGSRDNILSFEDATPAIDLASETVEPTDQMEAVAEPDVAATSPLPRRSARKPAPAVSPAYQRVETPEGKVMYRKL